MHKLVVVLIIVALCLGAVTIASAQSTPKTDIQRINANAKIDWTNLVYIVEGRGALPGRDIVPNRAQALLKATSYAKMDAIANLRMAIEGTTISYEATGKDFMADVTIRQKIEGFVKHVEVIDTRTEKFEGDTIVVVKMKAPMFGDNSPASVFFADSVAGSTPSDSGVDASVEARVRVVLKPDRKNVSDVVAKAKRSEPAKPYTGVILDATGFKLQRAMSPKIRTTNGVVLWDGIAVSPEILIDKGLASYATSMENAKTNKRAGSNPLIIRCVGRAGGSFYCDPVISDYDAQVLMYENTKSKILDNLNIVIIKDPVFK